MVLSNLNKARLIEKVHVELEEHYPMYDRETMQQVARTYLDCVDKKGFVFDFDQAWQWAGYSTKGNSKRILLGTKGKLNLQEGVDYKIELTCAGKALIPLEGKEKNAYPVGLGTFPRGKNGGQNREKIMLTLRCLNQFALAAHTPQGQCLRDVVLAIIRLMKQFMNEVQSGKVRIVRPEHADARVVKRLKVCDTQKALMKEVVSKDPSFGRLCGKINGVTNKAVTGRYKYETAALLNKHPKQVNARDWMSPTQLVFAEAIEMLSKEKIRSSNSEPLQVHSDVAEKVMKNIKDDVQGPISEVPLNVNNARKTMALEDKPQDRGKNLNTINNYFFKVF